MTYAVIRTDLMAGTNVASYLRSVKYLVGTTPTAIENGNVVKLGDLMTGEREIFAATAPAANDALGTIAIIATPEVNYDERKKSLTDFINPADAPCRAYIIQKGDIFSVTIDALGGKAAPAVGDVVELAASTKLNIAAAATTGSTVIGKIIAVETAGALTYYVIRVA